MAAAKPDDLARRVGAAGHTLRGLVVEDQVLIGLSIEAYLQDLGIDVGGPFQCEAEALRWLADGRPDFAIVDYALRDGPCLDLAAALSRRGVPFVVYSGHRQRPGMAGALGRAVWIAKPAPRSVILTSLARILPELEPVLHRGQGLSGDSEPLG